MRPSTLIDLPANSYEDMDDELIAVMIELQIGTQCAGMVTPDALAYVLGPETANHFPIAVIIQRLKQAPDILIDPGVVLFAAAAAPSTGACVAWAYTIVEATRRHGPLTLADFTGLFPHGVPSRTGYREHWAGQTFWEHDKARNMLDQDIYWKKAA